ncbi:hypothetical protein SAMN06269185_1547 [Natronoarchaeum philippinense]|uniref:ABC-2 type transport system permease protein n=1 Tax=Natronoarchaeum philippinense TaxID=558529 RepID=A0A285NX26_NATPI|nr:hypothetical protein [Natronoarchaeum philippinense]SNZ12201.1 hypothetical protein SAMN06269185_1547 [Natronoarchaeum philippinense]
MTGRLGQALQIARVETVRHYRRQREHSWRSFSELFLVVTAALVVVGRVPVAGGALYPEPGAYYYAEAVAAGRPGAADAVRGFAGIAFVLVALVTILWTIKGQGWRERSDGLLTTLPIGAIVAGDAAAKAIKAGRFLSVAIVGGAAAFALGAGRPLGAVGVLVGAVGLVAVAVGAGYVVGLAGLAALRRWAVVREHRLLVGSPLAALYFGLFVGSRQAGAALGDLPIAWYADLALASIGGGDPLRAAGAVLGTPVALAGLWAVGTPLARRAWLVDPPAEPTDAEAEASGLLGLFDRLLAATCSRPTRAVAGALWRRALREPQALLYVLLPVVLLVSVGVEFARALPASVPALVAVYGAGAAGAGATLNPLGNEGRGLPATLTTPGSARHVVRGYLVSAALPGAGVASVLTVGVAAAASGSIVVVIGAGLLAVALAASLPAIALGIGTVLPEFDAIRPAENAGMTAPHVYAVVAYSTAIGTVGAPVLAGHYLAREGTAAAPSSAVVVAGTAATALVAMGLGALGYRRAVRTFETYLIGG